MAETSKTEWILINKNESLNPGDRIRMFYSIIGPTYIQAAQIAAIEKNLGTDLRFTLITISLPEGEGWIKDFWIEILIKKPPKQTPEVQQASITGAIIGASIATAFILSGLFCWLSLREIRKMDIGPEAVKEVVKETGWTAVKIGATAIVGIIALNWWKK